VIGRDRISDPVSIDQLFAPEPFEQIPGQLAMSQLDHPVYWRVTGERGQRIMTEIIWSRSAREAADRFERVESVPADVPPATRVPTVALAVECLPFDVETLADTIVGGR